MARQIPVLLLSVATIAAIALSIDTSSARTTQQVTPAMGDLKKLMVRLNTTFTQFNATSKLRDSFFSQLRQSFAKPEQSQDFEKLKAHLNNHFNHFNATGKLRESVWPQLRKGFPQMRSQWSKKQ
uniref:Cathepsin propeptide inhibitor domain-containing protein n=1 Tax=Anopheles farauti TaxID=69004 RepID=A0A182QFV0_9DIPT